MQWLDWLLGCRRQEERTAPREHLTGPCNRSRLFLRKARPLMHRPSTASDGLTYRCSKQINLSRRAHRKYSNSSLVARDLRPCVSLLLSCAICPESALRYDSLQPWDKSFVPLHEGRSDFRLPNCLLFARQVSVVLFAIRSVVQWLDCYSRHNRSLTNVFTHTHMICGYNPVWPAITCVVKGTFSFIIVCAS